VKENLGNEVYRLELMEEGLSKTQSLEPWPNTLKLKR